ncbi:MAG TPA: glycoside hydrolase family 28 protein [Opitutaceae bacterium]|nr:glycoside hydrolase family 28 protein [Opitutaceae bacterium]
MKSICFVRFPARARRFVSSVGLAVGLLAWPAGTGYAAADFTVNIVAMGAQPDGSTDSTAAIQKAIDACHDRGGGKVIIPAGRFLTGTLQLRDNVTLHFQTAGVLLGAPQLDAYRNLDPFKEGLGVDVGYALIAAIDVKNIGLEGDGVIDGQGRILANAQIRRGDKNWGRRPFLVQLVRCSGVTLEGLRLQNSGAWTLHMFQCRDVTADDLHINSHGLPHNDGIDIDSCQNVQVKDCDIMSGDDALCFKTTSVVPCRSIQVTGCTFDTGESAIKMGTESLANFEDIQISNCRVLLAHEGGIKLFSVDGGCVQNVTISDIDMSNATIPIMVRLGARLKTFRPGDPKQEVGAIRNVTLRNITAKNSSLVGVLLTGIPGHPIENLTLSHVTIEMPGGGSWEEGQEKLAENESAYPEISMFGDRMPTPGVYARHVRGLTVDDFTLNLGYADLRPALLCLDGQDVRFSSWRTNGNLEADIPIRFESVRHALVSGFKLQDDAAAFVSVSGKDSAAIQLDNNNLEAGTLPAQLDDDVSKTAVESVKGCEATSDAKPAKAPL